MFKNVGKVSKTKNNFFIVISEKKNKKQKLALWLDLLNWALERHHFNRNVSSLIDAVAFDYHFIIYYYLLLYILFIPGLLLRLSSFWFFIATNV